MNHQTVRLLSALVILTFALGPRLPGAIRNVMRRKEVALQALAGFGSLALTFWVAFGIDAGWYVGQVHVERSVMVGGMLISGLVGVLLLLNIFFIGDGEPTLPIRAIMWLSLGVIAIVALVEVGRVLEQRYGIYQGRAPMAGLALFVIGATVWRPGWFWEHPKAVRVRTLIGDPGTMVFYFAIGAGFLWFSVLAPWGPGKGSKGKFHGELEACFALQAAFPEVPLGREIAYQPGVETGFAIWLPEMEPLSDQRATAYDGHWHRLRGDTVLVRFVNDSGRVAELRMAPGAYPRAATIALRPSEFGGTGTQLLTRSTAVDSSSCPVEIR